MHLLTHIHMFSTLHNANTNAHILAYSKGLPNFLVGSKEGLNSGMSQVSNFMFQNKFLTSIQKSKFNIKWMYFHVHTSGSFPILGLMIAQYTAAALGKF